MASLLASRASYASMNTMGSKEERGPIEAGQAMRRISSVSRRSFTNLPTLATSASSQHMDFGSSRRQSDSSSSSTGAGERLFNLPTSSDANGNNYSTNRDGLSSNMHSNTNTPRTHGPSVGGGPPAPPAGPGYMGVMAVSSESQGGFGGWDPGRVYRQKTSNASRRFTTPTHSRVNTTPVLGGTGLGGTSAGQSSEASFGPMSASPAIPANWAAYSPPSSPKGDPNRMTASSSLTRSAGRHTFNNLTGSSGRSSSTSVRHMRSSSSSTAQSWRSPMDSFPRLGQNANKTSESDSLIHSSNPSPGTVIKMSTGGLRRSRSAERNRYETIRAEWSRRRASKRALLTSPLVSSNGSSSASLTSQKGPQLGLALLPDDGDEASGADYLRSVLGFARIKQGSSLTPAGSGSHAALEVASPSLESPGKKLSDAQVAADVVSTIKSARRPSLLNRLRRKSVVGSDVPSKSLVVVPEDGVYTASTYDLEELLDQVSAGSMHPAKLGEVCGTLGPDELKNLVVGLGDRVQKHLASMVVMSATCTEPDTEEALAKILDLVKTQLRAERVTFWHVDAANGALTSKNAMGVAEMRVPISEGIVGSVARSGRAAIVPDVHKDSRWHMAVDSATGWRTRNMIVNPVVDPDGVVIGVLQVLNKQGPLKGGSVWTREDGMVLSVLSLHVASVLAHGSVYTQTFKVRHQNKILLEVAKEFTSIMEPSELLQTIGTHAAELLEADGCTIYLVDADTQQLWFVDESGEESRFPIHAGIPGHVATTGTVLSVHDAYKDPRFNRERDLNRNRRTKSLLAMPIRNNQNNIVGVAEVTNKHDAPMFDSEDEDLLQAFAAQSSVAIESATLFCRELEMRNYLENVLQSISNFVLTLNEAGCLRTSNQPVATLGISEDVARNMPYTEWLGQANPVLSADIAEVYEKSVPKSVDDYRLVLPDTGKSLIVNYSLVPLKDREEMLGMAEGDEHKGVVLILEDVTSVKKLHTTLQRYMSPAVADQVVAEGGMVLGGTRQKCTILFADIRGFTSMTEGMSAEGIVETLNEYFEGTVRAIFAENGVLDKYIGDAVMAVWGVPFESREKDEAVRACRACLGMMASLDEFNARRRAHPDHADDPPLRIGIGLSTGMVISGNIGSKQRMEYTVIGDDVNLASRIEGASKYYKVNVLITESTYEAAKGAGDLMFRELDRIRVVGKTAPISVYELIGTKTSATSAERQAAALYSQGLASYRGRAWQEALGFFEASINACPDRSGPAIVMIKRIQDWSKKGAKRPGSGWDGVYDMSSK